jgi:MFS family permease
VKETKSTRLIEVLMVAGMLPLVAAITTAVLTMLAAGGSGADAVRLTMLGLGAYAFAALILLPCVGRLAWLSRHGKINFTGRRQALVTAAVVMLIAPPVLLGALPLIA